MERYVIPANKIKIDTIIGNSKTHRNTPLQGGRLDTSTSKFNQSSEIQITLKNAKLKK